MTNQISERIRRGHLTHAGVDHLERVLEGLGVTLNAEQQTHLRDAVGPGCNRQLEKAVDEIFYPSDSPDREEDLAVLRAFMEDQERGRNRRLRR